MDTIRIPTPTTTARVAGLAKPRRGRVEYATACRRCAGKGGFAGWPGYTCYECGGRCRMTYSHAEWLFPADWTDGQVAAFHATKEAERAARAAERVAARRAAAEAARAAQSPEFRAVHARWLAGEFTELPRWAFVVDVLSRTEVLEPVTTAQAEAVVKAVADDTARQAAKAASRHLGTVGGRITVTGTVVLLRKVESAYGASKLVVVATADGDKVTMFSTAEWTWQTFEGSEVEVTGTVKAHEVRDGEKRTVLTRVKEARHEADRGRRPARAATHATTADDDERII
jgi:hypothetical protein